MALVTGDNVVVKASGAGLSLSSEACTELTALTFQITNTAKRVLDRSATTVVKANGVTQTLGTDYTLDRLLGIITFLSSKTGQTVIIFSGTYLPMTAVATANSAKFSMKKNNAATDVFNGGGWTTREALLQDVSGSLGRFDNQDDLFEDALIAEAPIVIEQSLNGSLHCRAWALLNTDELEGAADAFVMGAIEWEGTPDVDGRVIAFA